MANLANLRPGSVVLDPFVGTGSILVALSHFKAQCFGTDIDIRVLQGQMYAGCGDKSVKRDIFENFSAYGLERPELVRIDSHLFDRHCNAAVLAGHGARAEEGFFDAVVTDPPYGIRAGAKKSGTAYLYRSRVPRPLDWLYGCGYK
jgi:tRNA (guanine10-N2)-methyltransferase